MVGWLLPGAALCKGPQLNRCSVDQGEFLRVGPSFELQLAAGGLGFGGESLAVDELDGPAAACEGGVAAFVVTDQSGFEVGSAADVERAVGALQDVDEEGIC